MARARFGRSFRRNTGSSVGAFNTGGFDGGTAIAALNTPPPPKLTKAERRRAVRDANAKAILKSVRSQKTIVIDGKTYTGAQVAKGLRKPRKRR